MKNINIIALAVFLLIASLLCNRSQQKTISDLQSKINLHNSRENEFVSKIDEQGRQIATQNQIIVNEKLAIEELKKENIKLKSVTANVKPKIKTTINDIQISFDEPISIHSIDTNTYIKVPVNFSDTSNKWYQVYGSIDTSGLTIKSLSVLNELSITIGSEKQGFFKPAKPVVIVKNENPYSQTIKMNNIVVKNETKWYERKLVWFGAGIIATLLIVK